MVDQKKTLKDQQARTSEIIQRFHDAQTAAQHDAFEAARAGVTGAVALQRSGMEAVTKALDATAKSATPDEKMLEENVKTMIAVVPGLTPEMQERLVRDTRESLRSFQQSAGRATESVRETAARMAEQYTRALASTESRSVDSLKAMEENAQRALMLTNRVADAWTDAFFDAARATTHAMEEARTAVVETTQARASQRSADRSGEKKS